MAAKKKKPIGKLKDEAARLFQRLRRLEESDDNGYCMCVSCGKSGHWREMQGGHFIPRANSATLLMPENVHPQCPGCNGFGMKYGNAEKQYTVYILDRYGHIILDELMSLAGCGKAYKWNRVELDDQIADFKARIKELESLKI